MCRTRGYVFKMRQRHRVLTGVLTIIVDEPQPGDVRLPSSHARKLTWPLGRMQDGVGLASPARQKRETIAV